MNKSRKEITIRSSAAEYLTFVASTGKSDVSYEMLYQDENIWLTQKMMSALYDVGLATINEHIKTIYSDGELTESATIRKFRIVQTEGNRQVSREVIHYNLLMIVAVGFKVNNPRAIQFRKWAGQIVIERADANKENMGLTTWENAPDGKILKADVSIPFVFSAK